jgi:hypothetical protein
MEVLLLKAELVHVLTELEVAHNTEIPTLLRQAQMLYLAAQRLPRYVTEQENSLMRVEHSRLHSVMAGVLALGGDHDAVHRQINEANIALSSLPESEDSIARAVLDLRLIYCKLAELRAIAPLRKLKVECLSGYPVDIADLGSGTEKVVAILEEVETSLDRVEARMVSYRKSLWWWMTMCRYRMLWIEHSLLLAGIRQEANNTVRASERSVQQLWESAQELLKDSCMRTTFDSFQMSRILVTFSHIARLKMRFFGEKAREVHGSVTFAIARLHDVEKAHAVVCSEGGIQIPDWLPAFTRRVRQMTTETVRSNW